MNISASDVNKLRQQTGAGMMDCKKALTEANGDFEEAVVILRKKGQKVSASRADREANEGVVVAMSDATGSFGILVEVTCETDFVAKNEDFGQLARRVAQLAMDNKFTTLDQLQSAGIDSIMASLGVLNQSQNQAFTSFTEDHRRLGLSDSGRIF